MSVVEDLRNAKQELLRRGWGKGFLEREDGSLCALGAIQCVTGVSHARRFMAEKQLEAHLGAECFDTAYKPVAAFNDEPGTTFRDVLNLFDKALADLGGLG